MLSHIYAGFIRENKNEILQIVGITQYMPER